MGWLGHLLGGEGRTGDGVVGRTPRVGANDFISADICTYTVINRRSFGQGQGCMYVCMYIRIQQLVNMHEPHVPKQY